MSEGIRMRTAIIIVLAGIVVLGGFFIIQNIFLGTPLVKEVLRDNLRTVMVGESPLALPSGFEMTLFAEGLGGPRVMIEGPSGEIFASITSKGRVVLLPDQDGNHRADRADILLEGLNNPHGLALRCFISPATQGDEVGRTLCKLYVAETDRVSVYDYDIQTFKATNRNEIIKLPSGGNHYTRSIFLADDDVLLTSVGSTCNVCREEGSYRATVLRSETDGGGLDVFVRGLRNAVFLAQHPKTGEVWVTEMGRDRLSDNEPPDEINILQEGGNYGWPICYGKNVHDTDFDGDTVYIRNPCQEPTEIPSHIDIPAHSAPLGLAFIPDSWPKRYGDDLLVAYHGSWNRSERTGYKIVRFALNESGAYVGSSDFITGWLSDDGAVYGRPVGLLFGSDDALYISDDHTGVIYRVTD